ncbi:MAG: 1-phosphofructokinase family hexose kinase [Firmicutes bacterium]|nr:1-phosphofructokinase family hexose kinase [Bacillota bacterium]
MIVTLTMNPAVDKTVAVDVLGLGETNRVSEVITDASGKGINVSRALVKLGFSSTTAGFLAGQDGRWIEEELLKQGITPKFTWLAQGRTRVNTKIYEKLTGRTTEVNEPGPIVQKIDEEALWEDLDALIPVTQYLICSGSLPHGLATDFYARLIKRYGNFDVRICLDTSGSALASGVQARPYLIKPNLDEAEHLLGYVIDDLDSVQSAMKSFIQLGIPLVILSLGEKGAIFYREGAEPLWARAEAELIGSTSGCGDALLAGVVSGLLAQRPWDETVRWSIAVATATAEIFGTKFPNLEHIERVLPRVQVEKLSEGHW